MVHLSPLSELLAADDGILRRKNEKVVKIGVQRALLGNWVIKG